MKTFKFDVMRPVTGGTERFVATMSYTCHECLKFDMDAFYRFIIGKRPTLKGQAISVYLHGNGSPITFEPKHPGGKKEPRGR